jgi:hypothetical protein
MKVLRALRITRIEENGEVFITGFLLNSHNFVHKQCSLGCIKK